MDKLEVLTNRSLRAYELGRLRMAARVALVLLPVIALCLFEPIGRKACACCGAVLLALAVWFRFRDRTGVDGVTTGLLAGGIPLVAALAVTKFDPGCATAGPISYCTMFSVLIGAAAGSVVALREAGLAKRSGGWVLPIAISGLAASVGCIRLGVASILGVAFGIVVGRATTLFARRVA